ncbi:hypothetical protein FDP41_012830 [Naegleria fowleri]|uniref:Uncharacterized protein n=1 Tax=Naegleria fowleri TaxID=5763 RepID=A0A6A5C2R4_NAEFO|nr:uncharacterized protein FDP41_012830 [Naegleria fowleri]KAF0981042.1 hypothetical protein FDP41_012830 [Naegleria fowleri]
MIPTPPSRGGDGGVQRGDNDLILASPIVNSFAGEEDESVSTGASNIATDISTLSEDLEHDTVSAVDSSSQYTWTTLRDQAVDFYNMVCKRISENRVSLDEFRQLFQEQKEFFNEDFQVWPPSKPIILHVVLCGRLDLLRYLLEDCGYSSTVLGKNGFNVLHYACYYGLYDIVKYLLYDLDLYMLSNDLNAFGETPIDALRSSPYVANEQVRHECLKLFERLEEEKSKKELEEKQIDEELTQILLESTLNEERNFDSNMDNGETTHEENEEEEQEHSRTDLNE